MKKTTGSYREELLKDLARPRAAAAYLNAALEEGSREAFLLALRDVADARGIAGLAQKADLNRESMYRMLSRRGNPQISSLVPLFEALGLSLNVTVRKRPLAA